MARGVTTEWEDIQVKMGGYTAVEKPPTGEEEWYENVDQVENYDPRAKLTAKQLEEMVEDDFDLEEDEFMKEYREKRMKEM